MIRHSSLKPRVLTQHNPEQSKRLCCKLRAIGWDYIHQQRWSEAVPVCGSALETADILLRHDQPLPATERYLGCAVELSYALRKCRCKADLSAIISLARRRLSPYYAPASLQAKLGLLIDIVSGPLAEVDEWMTLLLAMDVTQRHAHR